MGTDKGQVGCIRCRWIKRELSKTRRVCGIRDCQTATSLRVPTHQSIYPNSPRPLSINPTANSNSKHYKTVPSHDGSSQHVTTTRSIETEHFPASPFKLKSQVADKGKTSFWRWDTRQDSRLPTMNLVLCRVDVGTDGRDPLQWYFVGFSGGLRGADHWGATWVTTGCKAAPSKLLLLPLVFPAGAYNLQDKKERCWWDATEKPKDKLSNQHVKCK